MASRVSDHLQMYGAAIVVVAKRGLGASSSSQGGRRGQQSRQAAGGRRWSQHSKQFVIDGNEFLIIETDNVLLASGTMKNGGSGALSKVSKFDFSYNYTKHRVMIMS